MAPIPTKGAENKPLVLEGLEQGEFDYIEAAAEVFESEFFRYINARQILQSLVESEERRGATRRQHLPHCPGPLPSVRPLPPGPISTAADPPPVSESQVFISVLLT